MVSGSHWCDYNMVPSHLCNITASHRIHWWPWSFMSYCVTRPQWIDNWCLNKMVGIFLMTVWMPFLEWKYLSKFIHEGPIHSKSALVLVMISCKLGDKPLPVPVMTQWPDDALLFEHVLWLNSWFYSNHPSNDTIPWFSVIWIPSASNPSQQHVMSLEDLLSHHHWSHYRDSCVHLIQSAWGSCK